MRYNTKDLLTVPGAAVVLGITPETAARQVRRGSLQVVRTFDGKALVPIHEIERYKRDHLGKPGRKPS